MSRCIPPIGPLIGVALAALCAAPAFAQSAGAPGDGAAPTARAPMHDSGYGASQDDQGPATGAVGPSAPAAESYGRNVVYDSAPTPPDQFHRLKAGDPYVISNGPVPDTPANRALYGQPMSRAGKMTRPTGD